MLSYSTLLTLVPLVAAHGFIRDPPARRPGDAFAAACGQQPFNQQSADINGNVQGIFQVVGSDLDASACNLWLCKGFQFDDNADNVQSYSLGETIDFDVEIAAPHTGFANVSVVKTSTDSIIGVPLIEFENYASNAGVAANNTAFSVTLPADLEGECTAPGDCVLQWFWDAPDIDQTYESCIDFTVSGGGSSPPPPSVTTTTSAVPTPEPTEDATSTVAVPEPTTTTPAEDDDDEEEIPGCEEEDDEDDELPEDDDEEADPCDGEDDLPEDDDEEEDEDDREAVACPEEPEEDEDDDLPEGGDGNTPTPDPEEDDDLPEDDDQEGDDGCSEEVGDDDDEEEELPEDDGCGEEDDDELPEDDDEEEPIEDGCPEVAEDDDDYE